MDLPKVLVDQVREGNTLLFLGTGASFGAKHPHSKKVPSGQELAKLLVDKFLGPDYKGISLLKAAELSITQAGIFPVQEYIAEIFKVYSPAVFHLLIPSFIWKGIATTNYDRIIELAYEQSSKKLQTIVPFLKNTDRIEEKLKSPDAIALFKLHGCITVTSDPQLPLILTTEQYNTHRKYRNFLFERFEYLAANYPVIYVGSSLEDADIRWILQSLKENIESTHRSYIILPNLKPAEEKFWETEYKLTCLNMTFEEFLKEIDTSIPKALRGVSILREKHVHPILERFTTGKEEIPHNVWQLLMQDVIYIDNKYKPSELTPQQFYKGYFKDLAPIVNQYDIRRSLTDNLLSEIFLLDEVERKGNEEFYLLKGHAGSGKTILLQRLFWDASIIFKKLCLWLKEDTMPDYEAVAEIQKRCNERIYICVDPIHKYLELIEVWLNKARRDKLPITVIGAERNHEWNISCIELHPYVTEIYELKYLNEKEIKELIAKLVKYKSLGYLEGLSYDKQREAFIEIAGRQLLVALYEATQGKSFPEIILDEFRSIVPLQAQSLYLTISILHRLGIPTRAGLINRVHGVPFEEFKGTLFRPLEFIVFDYEDKLIRDNVYRTRHPIVAEMVFEQVLTDEQNRYDEYVRILDAIDIGYTSDRQAFVKLTNARELMKLFRNPHLIRKLYEITSDRVGEDAFLWQQEAIFEMNSLDGSLDKAGDLLRQANVRQPNNRVIKHSISEWALKKSEISTTTLEKARYLRESQKISKELVKQEFTSPYPHVTLIKIGLLELAEILQTGDPASIERKVSEVEKVIADAKQSFPDDSFILTNESSFYELLHRHPEALKTLEKAFLVNKGSPYIAMRLAEQYESIDPEKAITILSECVDAKPYDRYSNYNLALLLMKYHPQKIADIRLHLRRSFTDGDANYAAQFWYARILHLADPHGDAGRYFRTLKDARIPPDVKTQLRGVIIENAIPVVFSGVIAKKELSFGFIQRDGYQDSIFVHRSDNDETAWDNLKQGDRVHFEMGFSYAGPKARKVEKETQ